MKALRTTVAAIALFGTSLPAFADVSVMYLEAFEGLIESGIKAYETKTGETVKRTKLPNDGYDTRVAVDLAAGTAADVVVVDSFTVAELASVGYLEPLGKHLKDWDQYKTFMPGLLDVTSYDGSVYALPTDTDVRMLWYDKSVFKKAGIKLPWAPKNWDDVLATAQTVKEKAGVDYAFLLPAGTKQGEAATMQGFYMALLGADSPDQDRNRLRDWKAGKWIGKSPALKRTLDLYHDVYIGKELTDPSINYAADLGAAKVEALANDQLGILASGSWEWSCLYDCNGVNLPSVEERNKLIGWAPWPGSGVEGALATTNISGGWAVGLNAKGKNKESGLELLTSIFDKSVHGEWTIENGRMAVRTDISESSEYSQNAYLAKATKMAATTTGRDTFPGYAVVSSLVQEMTASILDGVSPEEAMEEYYEALVDEFGEENVLSIQ